MATVTVYTADRMKNIEDKSVVSGQVVGDNLILSHHDGTTLNAGNVRGPKGTNGAAGYTSIVVCSSTSHPTGSALFVGLAIYETDTNKFLIWNGIAWTQPWNSSWGILAYSTISGTYTTVETIMTLTPTISFSVVANRRLRISYGLGQYTAGSAFVGTYRLKRDGNVVLTQVWNEPVAPGSDRFVLHNLIVESPPAGVHNYTFTAQTNAAGNMVFDPVIATPFVLIEDVGPSGQPA